MEGICSVHEGGLLLSVEGGIDEEFWLLPPDIAALIPATQASYQHEHFADPVIDVESRGLLQQRLIA